MKYHVGENTDNFWPVQVVKKLMKRYCKKELTLTCGVVEF